MLPVVGRLSKTGRRCVKLIQKLFDNLQKLVSKFGNCQRHVAAVHEAPWLNNLSCTWLQVAGPYQLLQSVTDTM